MALAFVLVVLGAISSANGPLRRAVGIATLVVATVTSLAVLLAIAGISKDRRARASTVNSADTPAAVHQLEPGREASGDGSPVSCGSGGCFQDGVAVYPVSDGDACFVAGDPGRWQANALANEYVCGVGQPLRRSPSLAGE